MLVAIHQPHYLPWLGYLHRMAQADLFVLLDHVQFERGNYQNRTRVRVNGRPQWLTVPLVYGSQRDRIVDKLIDRRVEWPRAHFETLRRAYTGAGYFGSYAAPFRRVYEASWERLVDLNDALLTLLRDAFGIATPLVRSSELDVRGARSELVLNICKAVGARALLVGLGASRRYLDRGAFAEAGIALELQSFEHPAYPQRGAGAFNAGLSAVDLLFHRGPASRDLLLGSTAKECRIAA